MSGSDSTVTDGQIWSRRGGVLSLLVALLVSLCAPPWGFAQEHEPPQISVERVEIGLAGHSKIGDWTRLRLEVLPSAKATVRLVVETLDPDDTLTILPSREFILKPGELQTLETCFRPGRLLGDLHVRLVDENGNSQYSERFRPGDQATPQYKSIWRPNTSVWLTLGDLPEMQAGSVSDLSGSASGASLSAADLPQVVRINGPRDLPLDRRGLDSVAMLVFQTAAAEGQASPLTQLTNEHDALLRDWVRSGGHLLISVASELENYTKSPLAAWVPAAVEGPNSVRQLTGLVSYSGLNRPLRFPGALRVAKFAPQPDRNTFVRESGVPLVVSVPYGQGRVTLFGLDLNRAPVRDWSALPQVLQKIAGGVIRGSTKGSRSQNRQLTHLGITDLATQWQAAQEEFPTIRRTSYWNVMGLLVVYVLVIGPLDWLLVHRWLKRPALTWLTLPVWVGLGAVLAFSNAKRANSSEPLVNQVDVIDIDAETHSLKGRSWVSLYSPENRRYAVKVEPEAAVFSSGGSGEPAPAATMTWSAIPENTIGGLMRGTSAAGGSRTYRFAPEAEAIENVPVLQWSTRTLAAEWEQTLSTDLVVSRLETAGIGHLTGTLTHRLPGPLEDCLLVIGGWSYAPTGVAAAIPPNFAWQPAGPQGRPRELRALMTGERRTRLEKGSFKTEILTTTAPYNPLNHDKLELLEMLSLHDAIGGNDYTGLTHETLGDLDLTALMQLGRGILIGRLKIPAAHVELDGQVQQPQLQETLIRLIVPVRQIDRVPANTIPKAGEKEST